jgi:hypothetical protein
MALARFPFFFPSSVVEAFGDKRDFVLITTKPAAPIPKPPYAVPPACLAAKFPVTVTDNSKPEPKPPARVPTPRVFFKGKIKYIETFYRGLDGHIYGCTPEPVDPTQTPEPTTEEEERARKRGFYY